MALHRSWEVAAQETCQRSFINRLGKKLRALLVTPTVIEDRLSLELAQVHIGVVDVLGLCDSLALNLCQLRVGDGLVLIGERESLVSSRGVPLSFGGSRIRDSPGS